MPTFADDNAEYVAHGIRLGGKADKLDAAISAAGEPLSVTDLERIARPDLSDHGEESGDRSEHVGMLKISATQHGYSIAARWFGWLPGCYATREAALTAYGYVLGGEAHGYLDDIAKRGTLAVEDIEAAAV